jgi:hypothetical protein
MSKSRSRRSRVEGALFNVVLTALATLARSPAQGLVGPILRAMAGAVRRYRRLPGAPLEGEALGRAWQRLMPSPKWVPITGIEGETVYGEIHVRCPLRGTGDVQACHRLMAYDRALMRPHGARFVVLQSQAEPGVDRCRIAMRPAHLPADDLIEAHERQPR